MVHPMDRSGECTVPQSSRYKELKTQRVKILMAIISLRFPVA